MPEGSDKERLAKLETSVIALMMSSDRRSTFETEVLNRLSILAVINSKMDDYKDYQKTCEAERKAHDIRISEVENRQRTQAEIAANNRRTFVYIAASAGSFAGFVVSVIALFVKH
jgi:hypothetical protein